MPVQTTYNLEMGIAYAGQRADLSPWIDRISKVAEGSDIDYGLAVVQGTEDNQAVLPSGTGGNFLGITEQTNAGVADDSNEFAYRENNEMTIARKGRFYAICEDGCDPFDDVFFRHTAGGGGSVIGAFRTDADTASADQVANAIWTTTAAAGELGVIEFA
jgi:hypothetical protein